MNTSRLAAENTARVGQGTLLLWLLASLAILRLSLNGCGQIGCMQLNADKTEVLWVASTRRQHQLPSEPLAVMIVDGQMVASFRSVRNLGVFIDSDLVMRMHMAQVVSRCFAMLRQVRQVRSDDHGRCRPRRFRRWSLRLF